MTANSSMQKKDFLFKANLCFTCFGKDHRAKECKAKRKCKVCSKEHPTSLHEVVFKVSALRKGGGDGGVCLVLLRIRHAESPNMEMEVYALLDECSNGTFISEEIAEKFSEKVKRPAVVSVSSINAHTTNETTAIDGLIVRGTEKFGEKYSTPDIALPTTFSKPKIPMDPEDIPRPEEIRRWNYLREVAETLSEVKNTPLGLLIGTNCKKALEPMQFIASEGDGPYAKRTRVGWCIVGMEETDLQVKANCNQVKLQSSPGREGAKLSSKSHISFHTKVTDISIGSALQDMWKSDFIERESEKKATSKEDNYFLELMQERVRFTKGHYELPLPLRIESSKMEGEGPTKQEKEIEDKRK